MEDVAQIVPAAEGWSAVFVVCMSYPQETYSLAVYPLIGWALVRDGESSEVVGLIVDDDGMVHSAREPRRGYGNRKFLGYLRPDEDLDDYDPAANLEFEEWAERQRRSAVR